MKRPAHLNSAAQDSVQHDAVRDDLCDELAANELRRRLRARGIVPIEPDECIRAQLAQDECLVAIRRAASFERFMGSREGDGSRDGDDGLDDGLDVDLYVTTHRLLVLGSVRQEYPLAEIREMYVAAGAVRLVVDRNRALEFGVTDPRVLRVEIAAVREANRTLAARASRPARSDQGSVR